MEDFFQFHNIWTLKKKQRCKIPLLLQNYFLPIVPYDTSQACLVCIQLGWWTLRERREGKKKWVWCLTKPAYVYSTTKYTCTKICSAQLSQSGLHHCTTCFFAKQTGKNGVISHLVLIVVVILSPSTNNSLDVRIVYVQVILNESYVCFFFIEPKLDFNSLTVQ